MYKYIFTGNWNCLFDGVDIALNKQSSYKHNAPRTTQKAFVESHEKCLLTPLPPHFLAVSRNVIYFLDPFPLLLHAHMHGFRCCHLPLTTYHATCTHNKEMRYSQIKCRWLCASGLVGAWWGPKSKWMALSSVYLNAAAVLRGYFDREVGNPNKFWFAV